MRRRHGLTGLVGVGLACAVRVFDPSVPISEGPAGSYEVALASFADDRLVAVWHDHRDGNAEIYARTLDALGRVTGPERRLTRSAESSYEPDVDVLGGDLVVAWYDVPRTGASTARVGSWTTDGGLRWETVLSAPGQSGRSPVVRVVGDRVLAVWLEEPPGTGDRSVWARWLRTDGTPEGPPLRLAPAGSTTWNLNAAVTPDARVWIVFDARAGTRSDEVFLVEVVPGRSPAGRVARLTADDGAASKYPDVALRGDHVGLTWFDERDGNREVYLAVGERTAFAGPVERLATRLTTTTGATIGAYLAWNDRRLAVAWSDEDGPGGPHEVYVQTFGDDGTPATGARRLTDNPTASLIPAILSWRAGFAMAWNEDVVELRGTHESGGRSEIRMAVID